MKSWQDLYCWYGLLKEKKCFILNDFSYVLDMSHNLGRISEQKIEKIEQSYEKMCRDFKLSNFDKKVLKNQLCYYGLDENKIYYKFIAMINSLSFFSVISFVTSLYVVVKR